MMYIYACETDFKRHFRSIMQLSLRRKQTGKVNREKREQEKFQFIYIVRIFNSEYTLITY